MLLPRKGAPQLEASQDNEYKRSFFRFLTECIWTYDEARAGEVRPWPTGPEWDPLWRDWEAALLTGSPLLIDKTRRVLASHVVCAFDLWLCLGGRDGADVERSRWPQLHASEGHRLILIQAKKLDGKTGAAEFLERIGKEYKLALKMGLAGKWPGLPSAEFNYSRAKFSNGSEIEAVPQGADQIRGPGATLIHMEELGVMEQAQQSLGSALPALSGIGHLVAVTTPNAASYAAELRRAEVVEKLPSECLPRLRLRNGWDLLEIRGGRDIPGYDEKVIGHGLDDQTFRREVKGDWTAVVGKLVYPEFGPIHCAAEPLPFDPDLPLILGWDFGGSPWTGTPACIISQVSAHGQWLLYPPVVADPKESVDIWTFAKRVADEIYEEYAEPFGLRLEDLRIVHYGDPAGANPPPKHLATNRGVEARSSYEIIAEGDRTPLHTDRDTGDVVYHERPGFGWVILPGEASVTKRINTVKARLSTIARGAPALLVDPQARYLLDAFQGGYHYHQRDDGRYELDPMKNHWSHGMNALEYAGSRLDMATVDRDEPYNPLAGDFMGTATGVGGRRRR